MPASRNARMIIIIMLISGGLAGMMAVNEVLGVQHRLVIDFTGGAGFVGIAVALMGRNHPVGIVLAAILFGVLYQGGAELRSICRQITARDDRRHPGRWSSCSPARWSMLRPAPSASWCFGLVSATKRSRAKPRRRRAEDGVFDHHHLHPCGSTMRLTTPLLLACLAGLYSERSGIFDIGLEGKMLAGAFAAASRRLMSPAIGLARAARPRSSSRSALAMLHGIASITHRGNQIISGVAINFLAEGLTVGARRCLVRPGRPHAAAAARRPLRRRSPGRSPTQSAACRSSVRSIPT